MGFYCHLGIIFLKRGSVGWVMDKSGQGWLPVHRIAIEKTLSVVTNGICLAVLTVMLEIGVQILRKKTFEKPVKCLATFTLILDLDCSVCVLPRLMDIFTQQGLYLLIELITKYECHCWRGYEINHKLRGSTSTSQTSQNDVFGTSLGRHCVIWDVVFRALHRA
ncbi:hypothetical protein OUZ56_003669 [Daphnia magna]|uniref:Uncharacterized protein n=1 Tax=Daphnia magna TaxID=35525 RepID=A0ABR0A9R8_9CRUS|nr:hypothetical protein OUZ56_003669 [Daphnia magna]